MDRHQPPRVLRRRVERSGHVPASASAREGFARWRRLRLAPAREGAGAGTDRNRTARPSSHWAGRRSARQACHLPAAARDGEPDNGDRNRQAARKPNMPMGWTSPTAIVASQMTPMAMTIRAMSPPGRQFSRCRSRRRGTRLGPSRQSICCVIAFETGDCPFDLVRDLGHRASIGVSGEPAFQLALVHALRRARYSLSTSRLRGRAYRRSASYCRAPAA